MAAVLFIPDRFTDHRMWGGIPDRLADRAAVSHLDQMMTLPWAAGSGAAVAVARSQVPAGWDVVVAAGDAGPLAAALGMARLAASLVLTQPRVPFDRIAGDVDLELELDLPDEVPGSILALVGALHSAEPDEWRTLLADVIRQTSAPGLPAAEVDLAVAISADHAAEVRAELQAFEAADAADREPPDDAQWARLQQLRYGWLDQLGKLDVPVLTVVPASGRAVARAIGRLAKDAQTVVTDGGILPPGTATARDQLAAAIERLLDRLGAR